MAVVVVVVVVVVAAAVLCCLHVRNNAHIHMCLTTLDYQFTIAYAYVYTRQIQTL